MKTIPHYCQSCGHSNTLGEQACSNCGTRLMIVVFPPAVRHDETAVPSYYEDHLLERVTLLENRLSQIAERLAMALDLMLRQTKTSQSDHILLETLIDSLNSIDVIQKNTIDRNWQKRIENEERDKRKIERLERSFEAIWQDDRNPPEELFTHLVTEGMKFLLENEEKQSLRALEQAARLAPHNVPLKLFIAETLFRIDKADLAEGYLTKALAVRPLSKKAAFLLGVINADRGEIAVTRRYFGELSEKTRKSFSLIYVRAFLDAAEGKWLESLNLFKQLPKDFCLPEKNYLIGCAYFELSKYKAALGFIEKAVEADGKFADAWFMASIIYSLLGNETAASKAKEKAWSAGEPGAQCLEFLKSGNLAEIRTALPFLRLNGEKNRLILGGSLRLSKIVREDIFRTLNQIK